MKPRLICEVSFTEMTSDGLMRHPSYEGLRTDKKPESIEIEKGIPIEKIPLLNKTLQKKIIMPSNGKSGKNIIESVRRNPG
ncbi:MAG: hypothetical protein WDM78_05970 [Puia sp.]